MVHGPPRQRGFQNGQTSIFAFAKKNLPFHETRNRHVCIPWKPLNQTICIQTSPLGSRQARCLEMQSGRHNNVLCQPSMDSHSRLVEQVVGPPPLDMHDGDPLLGWSTMMAPTSQNAVPPDGGIHNPPHTMECFKIAWGST